MSRRTPYVLTVPAGWNPDAPQALAVERQLYPELSASGGLATALRAVADNLGLDLGQVAPSPCSPRRTARVPSSVPDREPATIFLGAVERWFLISGWSRGVQLLFGATTDLAEMVRAVAAWRTGATLSQIEQAAAFVEITEMALAHERGPAEAVNLAWRELIYDKCYDGHEAGCLLPLVTAAAREPKLRRLFPFTSHWWLSFSMCTGFPYSGLPYLGAVGDGRYRVWAVDRVTVLGEAETAWDAVTRLVSLLPANIGPAVAGTADEPAAE